MVSVILKVWSILQDINKKFKFSQILTKEMNYHP